MSQSENQKFNTIAIHAGQEFDPTTGAVIRSEERRVGKECPV